MEAGKVVAIVSIALTSKLSILINILLHFILLYHVCPIRYILVYICITLCIMWHPIIFLQPRSTLFG